MEAKCCKWNGREDRIKVDRVIVTGATSMIGVAIIKECLENNTEVLAIIRKGSRNADRLPKSELLTVRECNLDEFASVTDIQKKYDVFYHLAWDYTSKAFRDEPVRQERNIKYTLDAVELAKRTGCRKFIGAGSQAEYGRVEHIISPDTELNPEIAYGIAKYAAGRLSRKMCDGYHITHIWGRIFSVYGRNDNTETMLNYAINQFQKGETAYFSAGTQLWDYLHEDDAGKIFYLLGLRGNESKVYCVASGQSRPLRDFISDMREAFGKETLCEFAKDSEGVKPYSLQADINELVKDICYRPQITFAEGIADIIAYQRGEQDEKSKLADSHI